MTSGFLRFRVQLICNHAWFVSLPNLDLPIYLRSSALQNRVFDYLESREEIDVQDWKALRLRIEIWRTLRLLLIHISFSTSPFTDTDTYTYTTSSTASSSSSSPSCESLPFDWQPWTAPRSLQLTRKTFKPAAGAVGTVIVLSTALLLHWLGRRHWIRTEVRKLIELVGILLPSPFDTSQLLAVIGLPNLPNQELAPLDILLSRNGTWLKLYEWKERWANDITTIAEFLGATVVVVPSSPTQQIIGFGPTSDKEYRWITVQELSKRKREPLLNELDIRGMKPVPLALVQPTSLAELKLGTDHKVQHSIADPAEVAELIRKATNGLLIGSHIYSFDFSEPRSQVCRIGGRESRECCNFEILDSATAFGSPEFALVVYYRPSAEHHPTAAHYDNAFSRLQTVVRELGPLFHTLTWVICMPKLPEQLPEGFRKVTKPMRQQCQKGAWTSSAKKFQSLEEPEWNTWTRVA